MADMPPWKCTCGMPLDQRDIRMVPVDEWEVKSVLRCQHCGQESPVYFYCTVNAPGIMAGAAENWGRE